jgi:hypothetical protein
MKTYNTVGSAVNWTSAGPQKAQTVRTFEFGRNGSISFSLALPVTTTAEATTNRGGIRRVMVKVATEINGRLLREQNIAGVTTGGEKLPISAHFVITAPEVLAQQYASGGSDQRGVPAVLNFALRALFAMLLGSRWADDGSGEIVVTPGSPIYNGLVGAEPLDTVNGSYGDSAGEDSDDGNSEGGGD